jgi:hypothetical protein
MAVTRKTQTELFNDAQTMAASYSLVLYQGNIYIPTHWSTGDQSVTPAPVETVWLPMSPDDIQRMARDQFGIVFEAPKKQYDFTYMVEQSCIRADDKAQSLLVRTKDGLKELRTDGKLYDPSGSFVPNTLPIALNEDPDDKQAVLDVLADWLDDDEEPVSLLRHLSTSLNPSWSAVKYILLLGSGRNGKSVLLQMLQNLFGKDNCSSVTRQEMATASAVVLGLAGKLANIVFDGMAEYVKDSSIEKTLIAGESVAIRKLYDSNHTSLQTNALFIEGLNQEPRSRDKSLALQARLVRFFFRKTYPLNQQFYSRMTGDDMVGALLALMLDNYVPEEKAAVMLAPTAKGMDLQLEFMYQNSQALPFFEYLQHTDPKGAEVLVDQSHEELAKRFNAWRVSQNDIRYYEMGDVLKMFELYLEFTRKSVRIPGVGPRKMRVITGFKPEAQVFVEKMKGEMDAADAGTVVED